MVAVAAEVSKRCAFHADLESAAVCRRCGRALCDDCFRHVVDDTPWCDACVDALSRDRQARMALGASLVLIAWGFIAYVSRLSGSNTDSRSVLILGGIAAPVVGLVVGWPRKSQHTLRQREPGERFESVGPAQPYRARLRRVARVAVPPLSARTTVLARAPRPGRASAGGASTRRAGPAGSSS